jgi:hypothetical protein
MGIAAEVGPRTSELLEQHKTAMTLANVDSMLITIKKH